MQRSIVADTTCLILFYNIGELDLLQRVFGQITITGIVSAEFNRPLPTWILIAEPKSDLYKRLLSILDPGEATSISLASEYEKCLLIIDELKGRRIAIELGLEITGSLGVLATAKKRGIIGSVKPFIEKIKQTNFRISDELINKLLHHLNEQ